MSGLIFHGYIRTANKMGMHGSFMHADSVFTKVGMMTVININSEIVMAGRVIGVGYGVLGWQGKARVVGEGNCVLGWQGKAWEG